MRFAKQSKGKKNIAVLLVVAMLLTRSEERRVGKECRL